MSGRVEVSWRRQVLLPLQPHALLAFSYPDAHAFVAAVTAQDRPPDPLLAHAS